MSEHKNLYNNISQPYANANSPTELNCLFFRHLDVITLHCSLLLNSCLIKVNFKPFDSWGCFVPDILFKIVDKLK